MTQTIVIAWADNTGLKATGKHIQKDGVNWFPEFVPCYEGHAAVWLNEGDEVDVENANKYLSKLPYEWKCSYLFDPSDNKALCKARQFILDSAENYVGVIPQ